MWETPFARLWEMLFYGLALFFGCILPVAVLIWFAVSLFLFFGAPKTDPKRKRNKIMLIISGILLGIYVIMIVGLFLLVTAAIRNM